jgi:hypothetical protein
VQHYFFFKSKYPFVRNKSKKNFETILIGTNRQNIIVQYIIIILHKKYKIPAKFVKTIFTRTRPLLRFRLQLLLYSVSLTRTPISVFIFKSTILRCTLETSLPMKYNIYIHLYIHTLFTPPVCRDTIIRR